MRHVIAALVLALSWPAAAKSAAGGHGHSAAGGHGQAGTSHASSSAASSQSGSRNGGTMRREMRRGQAPPLDPSRRVLETDCTKPFDPSAGNLRCR